MGLITSSFLGASLWMKVTDFGLRQVILGELRLSLTITALTSGQRVLPLVIALREKPHQELNNIAMCKLRNVGKHLKVRSLRFDDPFLNILLPQTQPQSKRLMQTLSFR